MRNLKACALLASVLSVTLISPVTASVFSLKKTDSKDDHSESSVFGSVKYGAETLDNLKVNGSVELDGTTIKGLLQANGNMYANNANIGKLHVNGKATLENCEVHEASEVNGALKAKRTTFKNELVCSTSKVDLRNCELTSLMVLKITGYPADQVVEISGKTTVSGPIVFEANHGKVIASSDCHIGEVRGGTLIRK